MITTALAWSMRVTGRQVEKAADGILQQERVRLTPDDDPAGATVLATIVTHDPAGMGKLVPNRRYCVCVIPLPDEE